MELKISQHLKCTINRDKRLVVDDFPHPVWISRPSKSFVPPEVWRVVYRVPSSGGLSIAVAVQTTINSPLCTLYLFKTVAKFICATSKTNFVRREDNIDWIIHFTRIVVRNGENNFGNFYRIWKKKIGRKRKIDRNQIKF